MAFKTFAPGVLTSSDVNTFLMRQSVITCTAATRPASPNEGMLIYETDTDSLAIYNGTSWVYQGLFQAYTPTFTGFTLGNGTASFEFARVNRVVFVRGQISFGSTSSITAVSPDTVAFSLPVATDTSGSEPTPASSINLGAAVDTSAGRRAPIRVGVGTTTTGILGFNLVIGTVVYENSLTTTTVPFTFATGDFIFLNLTYEAGS